MCSNRDEKKEYTLAIIVIFAIVATQILSCTIEIIKEPSRIKCEDAQPR